jgi:hypothetical protein
MSVFDRAILAKGRPIPAAGKEPEDHGDSDSKGRDRFSFMGSSPTADA